MINFAAMKYKIETATPKDASDIIAFQLAMARESEGTLLDADVVSAGVNAAIRDSAKARYLLAKDEEGKVLGSLMLTTEWSDWNNVPYYWIQSVYVRPEARRQGVFAALFAQAKTIARSAKAGALRLYVDKNNEVAQRVYQSLGMHDSHYLLFEL
jgi:ribosomal protein S18 acetylase RimI-like enzyme